MGIKRGRRRSSREKDKGGRDERREWTSRYHNKRRQINAFGLESNQHYSDNSPPANTSPILLGLILSTARSNFPPLLPVHDSHPLTSFSTLARFLRAVAPSLSGDTSLALLIPRTDDKYANKRTTGTDIGESQGCLKAELTPRSHKRSSTFPSMLMSTGGH